jgi:hypothetical protein
MFRHCASHFSASSFCDICVISHKSLCIWRPLWLPPNSYMVVKWHNETASLDLCSSVGSATLYCKNSSRYTFWGGGAMRIVQYVLPTFLVSYLPKIDLQCSFLTIIQIIRNFENLWWMLCSSPQKWWISCKLRMIHVKKIGWMSLSGFRDTFHPIQCQRTAYNGRIFGAQRQLECDMTPDLESA